MRHRLKKNRLYHILWVLILCAIYPSLCFSQTKADDSLKNKLVGRCWLYNTYIDEQNKTQSELCFGDDYIRVSMVENTYGYRTGRSFSWPVFFINGNKVYLLKGDTPSGGFDQCSISMQRDSSTQEEVPSFYNCTGLPNDWLRQSWGQSVIIKKIRSHKIGDFSFEE